MERIELTTPDGATLAARLFRPVAPGRGTRAAVVIGPAMGCLLYTSPSPRDD